MLLKDFNSKSRIAVIGLLMTAIAFGTLYVNPITAYAANYDLTLPVLTSETNDTNIYTSYGDEVAGASASLDIDIASTITGDYYDDAGDYVTSSVDITGISDTSLTAPHIMNICAYKKGTVDEAFIIDISFPVNVSGDDIPSFFNISPVDNSVVLNSFTLSGAEEATGIPDGTYSAGSFEDILTHREAGHGGYSSWQTFEYNDSTNTGIIRMCMRIGEFSGDTPNPGSSDGNHQYTDEGSGNIPVEVTVGSSYTVVLPANITLVKGEYNNVTNGYNYSGTYDAHCTGMLAGTEKVVITPDSSFTMTDTLDPTNFISPTVSQTRNYWSNTSPDGDASEWTSAVINASHSSEFDNGNIHGSVDVVITKAGDYHGTLSFTFGLATD